MPARRPAPTSWNCLSPDGRRVALPIGIGDHFAWVYTFETGTLAALFTRSDTHAYAWSPDSRRVALPWYARGVAIVNPDASVEPELVTGQENGTAVLAWSPDGTTLLYSRAATAGSFELVALDLRDRSTRPLLRSSVNRFRSDFSPDGRWLVYESAASGQLEVSVSDDPELRLKIPVSVGGGASPRWSHDGRELFYLRDTTMMAARRRSGDSLAFGRPIALFDGVNAIGGQAYAVAADGRFLLLEDIEASSTPSTQLTLVLDWVDELRRLVPAR
jgi:Tol biopolymer transport system component